MQLLLLGIADVARMRHPVCFAEALVLRLTFVLLSMVHWMGECERLLDGLARRF